MSEIDLSKVSRMDIKRAIFEGIKDLNKKDLKLILDVVRLCKD